MLAEARWTRSSCPALSQHARLRFDKHRQRWVLLLPERVLMPDEIALEVLELCDGVTPLSRIVDTMANRYSASREAIGNDVTGMLEGLRRAGAVTTT